MENNPDWQGLPDYFAIWADTLDWVENKTRFAYWNPGSSSYSYFFEATRETTGTRFRAISAQMAGIGATPRDGDLLFEEDELAEYAENREANSPTHPFVFSKKFHFPKAPILISPSIPEVAPPKGGGECDRQPISVPVVKLPEQADVAPQK